MSDEIQVTSNDSDTNLDTDDKALLEQIKTHFKECEDDLGPVREIALDDLRFSIGEQWPEDIKAERKLDGRPCLVINKMPQHIRQITNDQKLNRSSIKISPFDDKADVDTAKILQGMVKSIENSSSADLAYDSAFEGAVRKGFGFYRVLTRYCDDDSFNQEILIKGIDNHFAVFFDPGSKELDGSDANYAGITDTMSPAEFKRRWPNAELSKMPDFSTTGDNDGWVSKEAVRVVEYFYKKVEPKELVLLSDGTVLEKSKLPDEFKDLIVDERTSEVVTIKWVKTNGIEILERTDFPGKYIPIIPVYGEKLNVDGELVIESAIRHAKDPQRMYNYWASNESETIALAPRAPFIVAEGQIPPEYEAQWRTANRKNHSHLTYAAIDERGNPTGPPPQRNSYEAPIMAISQARLQSNDDIKATTGIQDATMGIQSNEQSGVAIQKRNIQSQTANYHFVSNSNASKRHCGRIVVGIIPIVYSAPQAVRIIGEDDAEEIVKINQVFKKDGEEKEYKLGYGKYDVVVETGPSFATKRQEAAAAQTEMVSAMPQLAQVAPDIIVGNMDWPGAKEIQARLRKTLPPGVLEEKSGDDLPPEIQAKMGQMDQMIQQLSQQLEMATTAIKEKRIELESKERIEFAKLDTQLAIAQANNESKEALAGFQSQINSMADEQAAMKHRLGLLNIDQPISNESGGYPAAIPQTNSPTGGIQSPGQPMG